MNLLYQFGISGNLLKEFDLKEAHLKRIEQLKNLEDSALTIEIGRHYLRNFIPSPIEHEDEYWMCSCFPGKFNTALRFNIYWHEVLNIQASAKSTWQTQNWQVMVFTHEEYLTSGLIRQLKSKNKGLTFDRD